jgi:hypothetical protein
MRPALSDTGFSGILITGLISPYVIDAIRALTSELTLDLVAVLVERNASLWRDCVPEDGKLMMREKAKPYEDAASRIPNNMIQDWVISARPDLVSIFSSMSGRAWLENTIAEIRREIWR